MPIAFECGCGKSYSVPDDLAGRKTKCTACGVSLVVPSANAPEANIEDDAFRALNEPDELRPTWQPQPKVPVVQPIPESSRVSDRARDAAAEAERQLKDEEKKARRRKKAGLGDDQPRGFAVSRGVIAGVLMMVGGAVWLVLGLQFNTLFIYPVLLFGAGAVAFIRGLLGHSEE